MTAWKKDFAIGVLEIDSQHQELFSRLDRLGNAIKEGKGKEDLQGVFRFLDKYVRSHFKAEEEFQARLNYPHLPMHSSEHRYFEKELENLEMKMALEGATDELVHLTNNVLTQWLIQHICQTDKALAGYYAQHKNDEWQRWLKENF